jgi:hypothetical protein
MPSGNDSCQAEPLEPSHRSEPGLGRHSAPQIASSPIDTTLGKNTTMSTNNVNTG